MGTGKQKVFILEDDPDRIEWFQENLGSRFELIVYSDSISAKENFFLKAPYDLILLDHDLGGRQYVESFDLNTGYEFSKFLVKNYPVNTMILIHSHNPVGADNMYELLSKTFPKVQVFPFGKIATEWARGTLQLLGERRFDL